MRLVALSITVFFAAFSTAVHGAELFNSQTWQQQQQRQEHWGNVSQVSLKAVEQLASWPDPANLPAVPAVPDMDTSLQSQLLRQPQTGAAIDGMAATAPAAAGPGQAAIGAATAGGVPLGIRLPGTSLELSPSLTEQEGEFIQGAKRILAAAQSLTHQQQAKPAPAAAKPVPAAAKAKPAPAAAKQAESTRSAHKLAANVPRPAASMAAARVAQVAPPKQDANSDYGTGDEVPEGPPPSLDVVIAGPLYITPAATFESLTEVNVDQPLLQIPQGFLGISHEWTHVEEINNIPGYKDIIRMLTSYGSGPFIIRVGGGSTDKQAYVFPQYVYEALRQVHYDTGVQFILGINFEKGDVELSRAQIQIARDNLPPESILAFEIGNEPNFYEGTKKNLTALQYVRCCYVQDWATFVRSLACPCGNFDCCVARDFAGPVWGHVNVYPTTLKWFLDVNQKVLKVTTLHWYKATRETYNTPVTLLEEAPIRKEMDNLRALVQTSAGFGLPLRVAEMNTISNSGRVGVSNVFAATLWTLDGAFEVAATGAVGVNFHQGSGQNLYTSILRWYNNGKLSPPVLRPPFYGMLMFQQAVGSGSQLMGKTQISGDNSNIKVWPLMHVADQELRVVIINKHASKAGVQMIRINRKLGYNQDANVTRLVARGEDPLSATSGITLGGYYFAVGGVVNGEDASELAPVDTSTGMTSWSIYMPPGSAALVRVKPVNGRRKLAMTVPEVS